MKSIRKCQGKIYISVYGYENDTRELWEIPEVREWFTIIEPVVKYWFYFLSTDPISQGLKLLMSCLCDLKSIGGGKWQYDSHEFANFLQRNYIWLNEITNSLSMTIEENKIISDAVFEYFK